MAPCCNNTVTPRMIKSGHVAVGDRIQLNDDYGEPVSAPASAASAQANAQVQTADTPLENSLRATAEAGPEAAEAGASAANSADKDYIPANAAAASYDGIEGIPGGVIDNAPPRSQSAQQSGRFDPLPYSQMTAYMNNVSLRGSMDSPSIVTPQDPMTPNGFDEEIDYDSVQAFNGFLRTQIGRYMRIEQLVGSNNIENRFGFLVGVGTNFIILQEITTGNIMVLDIFSIRLTYVYYSPPVLPSF